MDQFRVPKKVNRHVYKAVAELQESLAGFVSAEMINEHVKYTLRNTKPLANVDEIIHQSLSNLTNQGILACTGSSGYAIRNTIKRANKEYAAIPTYDLHSRTSSHCSSLSTKAPKKSIKRGSSSKAKRSLPKKPRVTPKRTPIKRAKKTSARRGSLICLGCRAAIAGLIELLQILSRNKLLQMKVELEQNGLNQQILTESNNMEMGHSPEPNNVEMVNFPECNNVEMGFFPESNNMEVGHFSESNNMEMGLDGVSAFEPTTDTESI